MVAVDNSTTSTLSYVVRIPKINQQGMYPTLLVVALDCVQKNFESTTVVGLQNTDCPFGIARDPWSSVEFQQSVIPFLTCNQVYCLPSFQPATTQSIQVRMPGLQSESETSETPKTRPIRIENDELTLKHQFYETFGRFGDELAWRYQNRRRVHLIRKRIYDTLAKSEVSELEALQASAHQRQLQAKRRDTSLLDALEMHLGIAEESDETD